MNHADVLEMIVQYFVEQFEIPREKITPQARLYQDLGLDSIDALDMVGMLEKNYDFTVEKEELKKIRTVQDVVEFIVTKLRISG